MKNRLLSYLISGFMLIAVSCTHNQAEREIIRSVDMSPESLDRIDTLIQSSIRDQWINGAVAYIARDGKNVYYKAFGSADEEKKTPMKKNAIFRIASQTKAITSVAIMMLFDEGKLLLDDPVSKYIPEFAHPVVLDQFNAKDTTYTTVPANREITLRDLLTHTSGIGYALIGSPDMVAIYAKSGIPAGFESRRILLGDEIKKLAKLPLAHQPGERFTYGLNCDVLGYVVEVVSGMSLNHFMQNRIFEPLGMNDTYFYIPSEKQSRLVGITTENEKKELIPLKGTPMGIDINYPLAQGTYYSGGAGLSSTIKDYAAFLQMLLNKGKYKGKRILSERSVELMTCNQIGDLSLGADKFGLGFEITTDEGQAKLGVSSGSFAWGGFWGTTYWVDPKKDMVCLLFLQQSPLSHAEIQDKFRALVYSAIEN